MAAATADATFSPVPRKRSPRVVLYTALGYLFFVVYGSLVPLDYHYHPLGEALAQFGHIPYLHLGVAERADWVANVVLYIPLAYLMSASLASDGESGIVQLLKSAWAFFVCAGVAIGVEFTQIFFPPRTVSLNDIIAELIGSAIGISIWHTAGARLRALWREFLAGGPLAVRAALTLYLVAYLAVSFFPYDFLLSWRELSAKLATHRDSLFVSAAACSSAVRCVAQFGYETLAVVPLGILVAMLCARDRPRQLRVALAFGAALGIITEAVQLFLESGIAQGISVFTRMAGAGLGFALYEKVTVAQLRRFKPLLRPAVLASIPLYLATLTVLEGWYAGPWLPADVALARLPSLHFLPFYYHYYTSEAVALGSLLRNATLYAPVGLAVWGWRLARPAGLSGTGATIAGLVGAVTAFAFESSKLFLRDQHPDPTNMLIACASAVLAYVVATWLTRWVSGTLPAATPVPRAVARPTSADQSLIGARPTALVLVAATAWAVASYPLGRLWLGLALAVYGVLLFRHPSVWLFVIPALLPTLDLAPWTGWIYLNAFDLFVFVTVAVGVWNARAEPRPALLPAGGKRLVAALAASTVVSTLIGLFPIQPLDANAFTSYLSHYNALRASKGLFEALALFGVLVLQRKRLPPSVVLRRLFLPGITIGLLGVAAAIVWERLGFTGLFNLANPYRATGTFSSMQVGGPYVEGFLVFALPLVIACAAISRRLPVLVTCSIAVLSGTYGLLVTFARGGYLGIAIALVVLGVGALTWAGEGHRAARCLRPAVAVSVLVVAALGVAGATSSFARFRFEKAVPDFRVRLAHWERSLAMINDDWLTSIFGMGIGRYPETYLLKNRRGLLPGNYRFESLGGKAFLRLGAGDSLYLGQLVSASPGQRYVLSLEARSLHGRATLRAYLCEKHILNSRNCWSTTIPVDSDNWSRHLIGVDSERLGKPIGRLPPLPVELAFSNPISGSIVDVTSVRLIGDHGRNLIANGNFVAGSDRWYFTTDDYLPWRVENVWLQIFFDQGWTGLLTFTVLTIYLCVILLRRLLSADVVATGFLAAFAGILTVGLFGSVLDAPRIALLFYLTLLLALWYVDDLSGAHKESVHD